MTSGGHGVNEDGEFGKEFGREGEREEEEEVWLFGHLGCY